MGGLWECGVQIWDVLMCVGVLSQESLPIQKVVHKEPTNLGVCAKEFLQGGEDPWDALSL